MCQVYFLEHKSNIINNQQLIVNPTLHRWEINIAQQNFEFDSFLGVQINFKNTLFDISQNITFQGLVSQCAWGINMTGDMQLRNHTKNIKTLTVC